MIKLEHGYVLLAAHALLDLTRVDVGEVLPLPAVAGNALVCGIVDLGPVGPCLMIDGDALVRHPELMAFSSLNTRAAGAEPAADLPGRNAGRHRPHRRPLASGRSWCG